jgi:hypothetical protein
MTMASSFGFPDWVPSWAQLLVLILGILIALAFMLMPFSVFGVKSRLEMIEARLDDIQGEIRVLALRLQEAPRRPVFEENRVPVVPPVAPAAWTPVGAVRRPIGAAPQVVRQEPALPRPRAEPRLDRFR